MTTPAPEVPTPIDDTKVAPLLYALMECLCEELSKTTAGAPCWCGVMPGLQVAADCACNTRTNACGTGWVRLGLVFPTKVFPQQDRGADPCDALLAATIELGVVRCAPVFGAKGAAPSVDAQLEAVHHQLSDMAALLRVWRCCPALAKRKVSLGAYSPSGPDGGCLGGTMTATVSL